jgi:hypothetical protein
MPETTGPCRLCGVTSYGGDDDGPVHACCWAWRNVIAAGFRCPACQVAQMVMSGRRRLPPDLPPLPRTLPDGSPFVPEVGTSNENDTTTISAAHLRLVT